MDRIFATLPVGKIVKRVNWGITTNTDLFALGGNYIYEGEDTKEEKIDLEKTVLRCENKRCVDCQRAKRWYLRLRHFST